MLKKLNIIHLTFLILVLAIIPIIGFLQGFLSIQTFIASLTTILLAHPLLYLIMMILKESLVLEYDTPKYMPFCMVLTILLGCLIWYLFFHLDFVFANTIGLWYGVLLLALAIPYLNRKLMEFINSRKKNKNGPKIVKNK